jgi:Sec-independent protein translocase protein TatA
MFDISPEKLMVLGVIATVILGPGRLPQAAQGLARGLHRLKTFTGSYHTEIDAALREPREALAGSWRS